VSLLLKHSKQADLFKLTSYGTTPMFIAAKSHPNIKNLFLEWVAKKQAKPVRVECFDSFHDVAFDSQVFVDLPSDAASSGSRVSRRH
jgi:hypothetical protein